MNVIRFRCTLSKNQVQICTLVLVNITYCTPVKATIEPFEYSGRVWRPGKPEVEFITLVDNSTKKVIS